MQSKGSAAAFLAVLLFMSLGACASFIALTSGREGDVVAAETWTPAGLTATAPSDLSPIATDIPAGTPSPNPELSTPVVPTATPVPPSTPTPPASPTPSVAPTPTGTGTQPGPPPPGPSQYRVTRNERDCSKGGLIGGWVYDAAGNGLGWANLRLYNDFGWAAAMQSEGVPQAGKYEFTMGFEPGLFHLVILDSEGQPVSPVADVDYDPSCSQRVDWERAQ
ncbi:MAG TPA: hypothetical protein VM075_10430 [Anaerolineae bacterium]|nr:hypothetical protein [Anaerolineae bacterium]